MLSVMCDLVIGIRCSSWSVKFSMQCTANRFTMALSSTATCASQLFENLRVNAWSSVYRAVLSLLASVMCLRSGARSNLHPYDAVREGLDEAKRHRGWNTVPGDTLLLLAKPLSLRDKAAMERVCKEWHQVLKHTQVGGFT